MGAQMAGQGGKSKQPLATIELPVSKPSTDNVNDKENEQHQQHHVAHPRIVTGPAEVADAPHATPEEPASRVNISIEPLQECMVGAHLVSYFNAQLLGRRGEKHQVQSNSVLTATTCQRMARHT